MMVVLGVLVLVLAALVLIVGQALIRHGLAGALRVLGAALWAWADAIEAARAVYVARRALYRKGANGRRRIPRQNGRYAARSGATRADTRKRGLDLGAAAAGAGG